MEIFDDGKGKLITGETGDTLQKTLDWILQEINKQHVHNHLLIGNSPYSQTLITIAYSRQRSFVLVFEGPRNRPKEKVILYMEYDPKSKKLVEVHGELFLTSLCKDLAAADGHACFLYEMITSISFSKIENTIAGL